LAFGPGVEAKTLVSLSGGAGDAVICYWQIDTMKCLAWAKVTVNAPQMYLVFNIVVLRFLSILMMSVFLPALEKMFLSVIGFKVQMVIIPKVSQILIWRLFDEKSLKHVGKYSNRSKLVLHMSCMDDQRRSLHSMYRFGRNLHLR